MTETASEDSKQKYVEFSLDINEQDGFAAAVLAPSFMQGKLSAETITGQLEAHGIQNWQIDTSAIDDVVHKFKKNVSTRIIVARQRAATFQLKIASDNLSVLIQVTPPAGGTPLTEEAVNAALEEKKIDPKRIRKEAISHAVTAEEESEFVIAQGKEPIPGRDSTFLPLIQFSTQENTPVENENGVIDFYAGKEYVSVEAGTPLMERQPPQPGKVGMDIYGQIIPADHGKELPFGKNMEGTEFASNDANLLVAKIAGHPVFFPDSVQVDDTLTFQNIDLSTGHVEFDGSVYVKGDVMPDMKLSVTGDLFIKGVVERAHINAGNDVHVGGGILGDTSEQVKDNETLPELECKVQAGGTVTARYINLAEVMAGQSIDIKEYAFNSRLDAGLKVMLGQNGGKGNLVGGETIAGYAIIAKVLGNAAYNGTYTRVGITREELQSLNKLKFLREQRLIQARGLRKILDNLKQQGSTEKLGQVEIDKAKKIHDTLLRLQEDVKAIDERLRKFKLAHYREDEPRVAGTSACFPNCDIVINGALLKTKHEHKSIVFVKRGRSITAKT
jgi:uncharacterized protein (DUF342 family)